jgi:DtxR family transcriptional regulator, Mn-dependent transcriptional regulator
LRNYFQIEINILNSFTEENYLKTIYALSTKSNEWVSTNALAESTMTRAASVSDMIKRLSEKQLIDYQKYKGVKLNAQGEKVALSIIRKHRLWEVFLVEKLHFGWDEVHAIAEELEHIRSERLIEKLDDFLGKPKFDPHGDPIPDRSGKMPVIETLKLTELEVNKRGVMVGVAEHSTAFLQHLDKNGLVLGCEIAIYEINEFDKSISIILNKNQQLFLSHEVARNILIR